jgi:hypothetical protein
MAGTRDDNKPGPRAAAGGGGVENCGTAATAHQAYGDFGDLRDHFCAHPDLQPPALCPLHLPRDGLGPAPSAAGGGRATYHNFAAAAAPPATAPAGAAAASVRSWPAPDAAAGAGWAHALGRRDRRYAELGSGGGGARGARGGGGDGDGLGWRPLSPHSAIGGPGTVPGSAPGPRAGCASESSASGGAGARPGPTGPGWHEAWPAALFKGGGGGSGGGGGGDGITGSASDDNPGLRGSRKRPAGDGAEGQWPADAAIAGPLRAPAGGFAAGDPDPFRSDWPHW